MCHTCLGLEWKLGGNGMSSITVTPEVLSKLRDLADERRTDVAGVVAEAIALEETFVQAQRTRSRVLIEKRGRVQEIVLPPRGRHG
jgi:hypothetical protein